MDTFRSNSAPSTEARDLHAASGRGADPRGVEDAQVAPVCVRVGAGAGGFLLSSAASAGTPTNATWFQVTQGIPMTRTYGQIGAVGTSTSMSIGVALSYPQFTTDLFVPNTVNGTLDLAIHIDQGGP